MFTHQHGFGELAAILGNTGYDQRTYVVPLAVLDQQWLLVVRSVDSKAHSCEDLIRLLFISIKLNAFLEVYC